MSIREYCVNIVLRREEKYILGLNEALLLSNRLEKVLQKDDFSQDGSYFVRSLYFDTIDDRDFFDKLKEQELRRKIRLRIYDPSDEKAKLELKQKQDNFQKKRSLTISKEHAYRLIDGEISVLLKYKNPFADEMYSIMSLNCYKPKTIIEYKRKAFMAKENHIRLTFDSDICATESNFDLFSSELQMLPIFAFDKVVFEVKYDKFLLGYISEMIACVNRRQVSSSKYCLGRSVGYPLYF